MFQTTNLGRPRIPGTAGGLFDAIRSCLTGDGRLLACWMRTSQRILIHTLIVQGWGANSAEEGVLTLVEKALVTHMRETPIHNEAGWISTILQRFAIDEVRRGRQAPLFSDLGLLHEPASTFDPPVEEILSRAVHSLPEPYRTATELQYLLGWSRQQVIGFLLRWRNREVGRSQCLWILKQSHGMLRYALLEGDPESQWPRRFTQKNKWKLPPPPQLSVISERSEGTEWFARECLPEWEGTMQKGLRWRTFVLCHFFLLPAIASGHGASAAKPGDLGPCDCYNAAVFTCQASTTSFSWFGLVVTPNPGVTIPNGSSVNIPSGWYGGVNGFGWGHTVDLSFVMSPHACTGLTIRIDRADGTSWQYGLNPAIPRFPAGGTGSVSGGLPASGTTTARLFCGCCPGLCALSHFHHLKVP